MGNATKNWQKANNSNAVKDVGATMLNVGPVASNSPVTNVLDFTKTEIHSGMHGAQLPGPTTRGNSTDTSPTQIPYSAGVYGYKAPAGTYLIRGVSTTISGAANNALAFPASDVGIRKSIHRIEQFRTLIQSSWNYVTGKAASNFVEVEWKFITGTGDKAARPSRTAPGRLTYVETGKSATTSEYAAKTD